MANERSLSVTEVFAHKSILITGATGFIGKLIVEKLLRCCPSVSELYIIVRSKYDVSPTERWKSIAESPIFDRLRKEFPHALEKVKVMNGDMAASGLGLMDSDRKILEDKISVVVHSAAIVKFNETLKDAVIFNARGSLELLKLAESMKKLQCFLHVSTTYSNSHLRNQQIEEKIYPISYNYSKIMKVVETQDPKCLAIITPKILKTYPNTYTFSKHLVEHIMSDYSKLLPIAIVRPSIVINTMFEPIPGWADNLNGFLGLMVGFAKGIMHITLGSSSNILDLVPADYTVNYIIVAAWHRILSRANNKLQVYNCAYANKLKINFGEYQEYGVKKAALVRPLDDTLWYPGVLYFENSFIYNILFIFLHLLPAFIVDFYLYFIGSRPRLTRLYRKIYVAVHALKIFMLESFNFCNDNCALLENYLNESDRETFYLNAEKIIPEECFKLGLEGVRKYVLKEDENDIPQNRARLKKLYWIHNIFRACVVLFAIWTIKLVMKVLNLV